MDTAFIGKVGDDDLGAALELVPEDLKPEWFEGWDYFHIEGYLVQNQATIRRAVELAKAAGWKVAEGLFLVLGIVLGIVVCTLSPTRTPDALWFVFIAGAIAICAMILPGVSGSFILLILGKYKFIMAAITAFVSNAGALWGSDGADAGLFWQSAAVLAVFLVGAVTGILGFSKFLH